MVHRLVESRFRCRHLHRSEAHPRTAWPNQRAATLLSTLVNSGVSCLPGASHTRHSVDTTPSSSLLTLPAADALVGCCAAVGKRARCTRVTKVSGLPSALPARTGSEKPWACSNSTKVSFLGVVSLEGHRRMALRRVCCVCARGFSFARRYATKPRPPPASSDHAAEEQAFRGAEDSNYVPSQRVNVNWFPGHMAKATKQLKQRLREVDVVLEMRDARISFLYFDAFSLLL